MPKTNTLTRLREEPDGVVIILVNKDKQVDVLETQDQWLKVRLPTVHTAPTGWLLKAHVSDEDAPVPPIDKTEFARECAHQERAFGVSGHYLAAIAQLRSQIVDGKAADGFGLYRLLAEEWAADWNTKEYGFEFVATDINHWRNQCTLFALMAHRALDSYIAAFTTRPTAIELYLTQIIGIEALKLLKGDPAMTVKAALVAVGTAKMPPGPTDPDKLIERHATILKSTGGPAKLQQVSAQAEIVLNATLVTTRPLFAAVKVTELAAPSAKALGEEGSGAAGEVSAAVEGDLQAFHGAFDDLPGARWKLTPRGLLVEGEAQPIGSGGTPTTVGAIWSRWQTEIIAAAKEFGVPIELIIATIGAESSGNEFAERHEPGFTSPEATPHRISVGLMQTLISTARGESAALGVQAGSITRDWLRSGENSIRAGTSYILRQKAGTRFDPPRVACAYNAGSVRREASLGNRWKMVQFPIGTGEHADRWVKWFNDCFVHFTTPAALPDPSLVKSLNP
jgi:hypothetical protein